MLNKNLSAKIIVSETIGVEHIQQKKIIVCILFILCSSFARPATWLGAVLLLAEQFCHLIQVQFVAVGIAQLPFVLCH